MSMNPILSPIQWRFWGLNFLEGGGSGVATIAAGGTDLYCHSEPPLTSGKLCFIINFIGGATGRVKFLLGAASAGPLLNRPWSHLTSVVWSRMFLVDLTPWQKVDRSPYQGGPAICFWAVQTNVSITGMWEGDRRRRLPDIWWAGTLSASTLDHKTSYETCELAGGADSRLQSMFSLVITRVQCSLLLLLVAKKPSSLHPDTFQRIW